MKISTSLSCPAASAVPSAARGTGLPVAGSTRLRVTARDAAARGLAAPADAVALAPRPRGAPV